MSAVLLLSSPFTELLPELNILLNFQLCFLHKLYLVTTDSEKNFEYKGYSRRKGELKEHLDKIYFLNECHCSRTLLYGRDLLETCSWISERKISQHCSARINKLCWAGFANCLPHSSTSEALRIHCRSSFWHWNSSRLPWRMLLPGNRDKSMCSLCTSLVGVCYPPKQGIYVNSYKMQNDKLAALFYPFCRLHFSMLNLFASQIYTFGSETFNSSMATVITYIIILFDFDISCICCVKLMLTKKKSRSCSKLLLVTLWIVVISSSAFFSLTWCQLKTTCPDLLSITFSQVLCASLQILLVLSG